MQAFTANGDGPDIIANSTTRLSAGDGCEYMGGGGYRSGCGFGGGNFEGFPIFDHEELVDTVFPAIHVYLEYGDNGCGL